MGLSSCTCTGLSSCMCTGLSSCTCTGLSGCMLRDLAVACWDLATQLIASHLPLLSNMFPPHLILCPTALVALENAKPTPASFNILTIHPQSVSSSLRNSYKFLRPLDSEQDRELARNQRQILQALELMRKWMV